MPCFVKYEGPNCSKPLKIGGFGVEVSVMGFHDVQIKGHFDLAFLSTCALCRAFSGRCSIQMWSIACGRTCIIQTLWT